MSILTKTEVPGDEKFSAELAEISRWPGVVEVHPGGSRYTVSPAVLDTDMDILVQTEDYIETMSYLAGRGFENQGRSDYDGQEIGEPLSWRKGEINIILLSSQKPFLQRAAAAEFCRAHNIRSKKTRAGIHQAVRGEVAEVRPETDDDLLGDL